jgi:CRISPR-associated protein Cas1
MGNQLSSTLPVDWATVDMVAQYAYCPRRFHLMYVEGRWDDNVHTIEGKHAHRRVDRLDHLLPETMAEKTSEGMPGEKEEDGDDPPQISRSVSLGSETLGLMGKLDLVSSDPISGEAAPVETKKSRVPNTPERSYETERIQLMAQGLLLREHGYESDHGFVYYAGSRSRVRVEFDDELERITREVISNIREGRNRQDMPPPLEDSPKCWGCSLCGICLPDETVDLKKRCNDPAPDSKAGKDVRRLYPARDRALPFYVQEQGAKVGKSKETLSVSKQGKKIGGARLIEVSQLFLMGNVQVSAQALHLLMEKGIPVVHFSTGGWFHGMSSGIGIENAYNRSAQYQFAADPQRCLSFARDLVRAKMINQRCLLLRNGRREERGRATDDLATQIRGFELNPAKNLPELLGREGLAAATYFPKFSTMLKTGEMPTFDFSTRNRRPPKDPINALLSFTYAILAKECLVALWAEGLDPYWGLYHQPRHGRPALALDLMEPFRPVLADSVVITAINTGMVQPQHFVSNRNGCTMQPHARKALLRAWEQRLDQLYTHPEFDYRCSWRTIIRIQARLLARWFRKDIPTIPWPTVR